MSIRIKLLGVLSLILALACGLAFYGVRSISATGDLVVQLYDGPLMGINHARAAHAELNEARLVLLQAQTAEVSNEGAAESEKLVQRCAEDPASVRDRIRSASVGPGQCTSDSHVRD